jgi:hypothetical protein
MDYHLKANSEQELWQALESVGAAVKFDVKNSSGEVIESRYSAAQGYDLDIIGTIYKPTGNLIQHTVGDTIVEVPETEAIDGFHANLRGPVDLAPKVEYIQYQPTEEELADPNFTVPEPEQRTTPSPLAAFLVYPSTPVRVWF